MIFDCIENAGCYPFGPLWEQAVKFLNALTPDTPCGRVELLGDDLFVIIDSYRTKAREDAKLETHQRYVDIQVLLSGTECLEVFPKTGLTVREPYDPDKDAEFYKVPKTAPVRVTLTPGRFIVFFPKDAHMPCLCAGETSEPVQKVVIKLRTDRIR